MAASRRCEQGEPFVAAFNARCRRNADLVMVDPGRPPARPAAAAGRRLLRLPARSTASTDSLAFAQRVLAEAKVGIAAGYTFGPGNDSHVRLCFAIATDRLEQAMHRMIRVLDQPP